MGRRFPYLLTMYFQGLGVYLLLNNVLPGVGRVLTYLLVINVLPCVGSVLTYMLVNNVLSGVAGFLIC